MLIALLAWLALQDDGALIRQLGDNDPAVRERATAALLERDVAVLEALRARKEDPDPELRHGASEIAAEISRRDRVRLLHPRPKRVTVSLKDASVAHAAREALFPFGLDTNFSGHIDFLKTRKVSLELREAGLWEAFEGVCRAGGITVQYFFNGFGVSFQDGQGGVLSVPHADVGELRFFASHYVRKGQYELQVFVVTAPRYRPLSQTMEHIVVLDDDGRELPITYEHPMNGHRRSPGSFSDAWLWKGLAEPPSIKEWSKVRIRGTLVQGFPHDLERFEAALGEAEKPVVIHPHGMTLTCHWKKLEPMGIPPRPRWTVTLEWKGATVPKTYLLWIEDAQGRWLVDGHEIKTGEDEKVEGEVEIGDGLAGPTPPGKLVLVSVEGEDQVRTPFTVPGLGGPPPVEK